MGSEFVQKYLGEGPRMVRDVFRLAKENAPAIIFIDEIEAIATKRFDAQTGGKDTRWTCIAKLQAVKKSLYTYVKITDFCDARLLTSSYLIFWNTVLWYMMVVFFSCSR